MAADAKCRLLTKAARGTVTARTDARASSTGFPFKVAQLEGTLSDEQVYIGRPRLCDLGVLQTGRHDRLPLPI